ncbi:rCG22261, isoform CRA_a, partial [Rattus norvegicus]
MSSVRTARAPNRMGPVHEAIGIFLFSHCYYGSALPVASCTQKHSMLHSVKTVPLS